ncbi:hypothetical protein [Microbacterium oleivorans]|uniref:Uncharacterized protein n=1 Tax=Microbacterium oleivorans TaxID=273677 RepID=A0A7D5IS72_9MICO|nr:hypothetical protein [Microbacterium oleivorans]QLD11074.1 hypothetical protein HW566_04310 [Microbacterium oleivorans]
MLLIVVIVGLAAGAALATARVPRPEPGALTASLVLIAAGASWIVVESAASSASGAGTVAGLGYAASCLVGYVGYGAQRWARRIPAAERPPWGRLLWLTVAGPAHLRTRIPDESARGEAAAPAPEHARRGDR